MIERRIADKERSKGPRRAVASPKRATAAPRPASGSSRQQSLADRGGKPYAFEFRVGGDLPAFLARAAKEAAREGPPPRAKLRRLQRVAREHGRIDDVQRMFLAGLLDADNARTVSRMPLASGASVQFSLASIRAGMPRIKTLERPRRQPAKPPPQRQSPARATAPPVVARAATHGLKPFEETRDDVWHWARAVRGALDDAWFTEPWRVVDTFRAAAKQGRFVELHDRLDMPAIFEALGPRSAVEIGVLGPVTNGRHELNRRRVEYVVWVTNEFGPATADVFVHRMLGRMQTDDAVAVMQGLKADARLAATIALMPAVKALLERRGIIVDWWSDRPETGSDFWRSAWEAVARNAYAHTRDGSMYYGMRAQLSDEYRVALDEVEKALMDEYLTPGNAALGALDHITFGFSSAVVGLVIDTPKGVYHLLTGEYQKAGPELVGLMMMVATYGIAKGTKGLGAARGDRLSWAAVLTEYSGPKSKALARLEAILSANPKARAAAAALAELSEAQIEAGARHVTAKASNAAFVHRGGFPALKALIEANGDLGAAEIAFRARKAAPQLTAGTVEAPVTSAEATAKVAPPQPAPTARARREARAAQLAAEARRLGRPLQSDLLAKLARSDPERFEKAAASLEAQLEDLAMRRGDRKRAEVADEFAEAGRPGERRDVAPAESLAVPKQKSTVRLSHDAGVEGGRKKAAEHGVEVAQWNNPESHRGDYGRGFDDVGRKGSDRIVLEYKAEGSELAPRQMTDAWVGERIAMLKYLKDGMADELLAAARDGKLRGRVYRTTIGPKGRLHTVLEERMTYDRGKVLKAYETRLAKLRKATKPIH